MVKKSPTANVEDDPAEIKTIIKHELTLVTASRLVACS